MDDLEDFVMQRLPTADRPLLGLTVLVVEDSRFACEAIRLMCLRSGARIRRADCLNSAHRHLRMYRPAVAIIDLGLPDGSGEELIAELAECSPRIDAIIGTSGDDTGERRALEAGADAFLEKPVRSLSVFQETIISKLPDDIRPVGPRAINNEAMDPDRMALKDDLAHVADLLDHKPQDEILDYIAQFVGGVAVSADDQTLQSAAFALREARAGAGVTESALSQLNSILKDRLAEPRTV